ncbi:Coagulation factor X, partial [Tinamus guttatus]
QAALLHEGDHLFCGGTILNEYFILTAAHCAKQPGELVVLVGDMDTEKQEQGEAVHRVEKRIIHDAFDFQTFDSDIALIKLKEPIKFSEYVIPACLPEEDFATEVLMRQPSGIISGFGSIVFRGPLARRMKVFQIPYVDMDTCKPAINLTVTENMFCAGYSKDGRDACLGDGGGPHVTQYNGTYFVTGIISWGEGCGTPGKYGIYTNLSKFLPWI